MVQATSAMSYRLIAVSAIKHYLQLTCIAHQHAADHGLPVSRGHGPEASLLVEADAVAVHLQRRGRRGLTQAPATSHAPHLDELPQTRSSQCRCSATMAAHSRAPQSPRGRWRPRALQPARCGSPGLCASRRTPLPRPASPLTRLQTPDGMLGSLSPPLMVSMPLQVCGIVSGVSTPPLKCASTVQHDDAVCRPPM